MKVKILTMVALLCLGFTMRAQTIINETFDSSSSLDNWTITTKGNGGTATIVNGTLQLHTVGGSDGYMGQDDHVMATANYSNLPTDFTNKEISFNLNEILISGVDDQKMNISSIFWMKQDDNNWLQIALSGWYSGYHPDPNFSGWNYYNTWNGHRLTMQCKINGEDTEIIFQNLSLPMEYLNYDFKLINDNGVWLIYYKESSETVYNLVNTNFNKTSNLQLSFFANSCDGGYTYNNGAGTFSVDYFVVKEYSANSVIGISTNNQTATVGRTIEIPVLTSELESSDNVIAYQFDFNYDNTKLEYLSNTLTGTLAEGGSLQLNPTTGKLSIAWARQTPMVGEGAIIKLQFKVIDAGATTPTITNALYNTETVNATNGTITATYKYGDIDANDHVQAYDAALAIQYSVGLDPLPTIDPLPWENWRIVTANVDGVDGVTANDASEILKYTVGLITEFPVENTKKLATVANADISVSVEDGEIVLTSTGELFGLNVFVNENYSVLGEPEIFVEGALFAKNISETNYAFGLATAYSPENNVDIIKIPYSTTQEQVVTFDMIVNTELKSVTVGLTTGIVTINEQSVIIYPNPANSVLYLKGVENVNVTIFDISGREVLNQLNVNKQVDISTLPNGIYTVKIENGNENITRKLIKN